LVEAEILPLFVVVEERQPFVLLFKVKIVYIIKLVDIMVASVTASALILLQGHCLVKTTSALLVL
jgi:hypothetical protein